MTVDSLNVNFQFEVALTTAVKIKQIIFRMKVPGKHHFSIKKRQHQSIFISASYFLPPNKQIPLKYIF